MKRIIPIFAFLLAIFTSCTVNEKSADNTQTHLPDTQTSASVASVPEFRIDGELPDIGTFSGKPERFYSEYTPYFIPSDKYGRILPYVGSYKIFSNNEPGYGVKQGYSSYGFCTEDGRIIMDAASENRDIYYTKTNDGFGFYRLSITDDTAAEVPDDIYVPQRSMLIPETGEWCIELDGNSWISEAKNGMIIVMSYADDSGRGECTIYDYNGNEISRLGEYDNVYLCDNGLILVMRWDNDDPFHGFLDKDGNIVLGPYKGATQFSEYGIANIETDDGWHLIDEEGNILTKQPYENISLHKKDYTMSEPALYVARHMDNRYKSDIYSTDGKYITTVDGTSYFSVRFPKNGEIIYYYSAADSNKMVWKRMSDNSEFVGVECGKSPNSYSGNDDIYVYEDNESRTAHVFDADGRTILMIENFMELSAISKDDRYFVYSTGSYEEYYDEDVQQHLTRANKTSYLYDTNTKKSTIIPAQSSEGYASFVGENSDYLIIYACDDVTFFGDYDRYSLYDVKNDRLLFENSKNIYYNNIDGKEYFTVCTESVCTLYDSDMNTVIRCYND